MRIERNYHFYASHRLHTAPDGHKCKSWHGHTYHVKIEVETGAEKQNGVSMFFSDIDRIIDPIIAEMDHAILICHEDKYYTVFAADQNQKLFVMYLPTSVENLCRFLISKIEKSGLNVESLSISETTSGWVKLNDEQYAEGRTNSIRKAGGK